MPKKIGLYFGSFNPIHIGHLLVATHLREAALLDEVWFIISPQNPFKVNHELEDEEDRLEMVKLAIEDIPYFKAIDIEFHLPRPSYTHITLKELYKQFSQYSFKIIIGEDNVSKFQDWKEAEWIQSNFEILIYNRTGYRSEHSIRNARLYTLPLIDISSTEIRERIKNNKSIDFFIPDAVKHYITFHKLYSLKTTYTQLC